MSTSSTSTRILRGFSRAGKLAELRLKRLYRRNRALRFAAMVADSLLWTAIIGVWIWMFTGPDRSPRSAPSMYPHSR